MPQPIVIAHHLIWTAYGHWLPNDPRGSGSKSVRRDVIAELGDVHLGRKKVQPSGSEIHNFYRDAAGRLKHPVIAFDNTQRDLIGTAFAEVIERERYTCYACAVMPDHVHILIRKQKHTVEQMMSNLKEASRLRLSASDTLPLGHPVWTAGGGWKVFLDHPDGVRRTIPYIEKNPLTLRLSLQDWAFVKRYDGWPLHEGHSPNSPYARRLRAVGRYS